MPVQSEFKERTDNKLQEPKHYKVIMMNDDFTTMEFVVEVLIDIFKKDPVQAEALMMAVHKSGKAVVGIYPYDIAMSKVNTALERAKAEGFPFRMTVEEE